MFLRALGCASLAVALAAGGCRPDSPDQVVIDTSFLKTLPEKPTVEHWLEHADELHYLVAKGDKRAVAYALRVVPVVCRSDAYATNVETLAAELYDHMQWADFGKLPIEDQVTLIRAYDWLQPVDWDGDIEEYLGTRPDVARALAASGPRRKGQDVQ